MKTDLDMIRYFLSDELGKTFAESSDEEKNSISHRGRALKNLYDKLKKNELNKYKKGNRLL